MQERRDTGGFRRVAQLSQVPPGGSTVVTVDNRAIALFNVEGTVYAIYNVCPHEGGPLNEGRLKGHIVSCPWHDLAFDIRNGQGIDGGGYCVGSYDVRIEGDDIMIGPRRKV